MLTLARGRAMQRAILNTCARQGRRTFNPKPKGPADELVRDCLPPAAFHRMLSAQGAPPLVHRSNRARAQERARERCGILASTGANDAARHSRSGIDFYAGVPDSLLKDFCGYAADHMSADKHIISANEGAAVALATGYHLATGKVPLVYLQNSGLGNTINPLLSLAAADVYSIPMLMLIGWRGEPGKRDEPQHNVQVPRFADFAAALCWRCVQHTTCTMQDATRGMLPALRPLCNCVVLPGVCERVRVRWRACALVRARVRIRNIRGVQLRAS